MNVYETSLGTVIEIASGQLYNVFGTSFIKAKDSFHHVTFKCCVVGYI